MQKNNPICLSLMRECEREEVLAFLAPIIRKWYDCAPLHIPSITIIARRDMDIVGTITTEFSDGQSVFLLETIYEFDHDTTPLPFKRNVMVEFGRLAAAIPGASTPLLYASAAYSINRGKKFGLVEMKEHIASLVTKIGIRLYPVQAKLMPEQAPEKSLNYYTKAPPPKLYMVDLDQKEQSLRSA